MWQAERRQRIQGLLETFGQLKIDRITAELGVSRETVRRDLKSMELDGVLRRVHGGIVPAQQIGEASYPERSRTRQPEKQSIARACLPFVSPGQTILIDAGSTTTALAESLATMSGLLVFTNSIDVAAHLGSAAARSRQNRVILFGGDYVEQPPSTVGASMIAAIHEINADLAFSSPFGLDAVEGASSFVLEEADVARAMFARARTKILLADHSKIGMRGPIRYARIETIDKIVIDGHGARHPDLGRLRSSAGDRLCIA